jgi:hypothetical protein
MDLSSQQRTHLAGRYALLRVVMDRLDSCAYDLDAAEPSGLQRRNLGWLGAEVHDLCSIMSGVRQALHEWGRVPMRHVSASITAEPRLEPRLDSLHDTSSNTIPTAESPASSARHHTSPAPGSSETRPPVPRFQAPRSPADNLRMPTIDRSADHGDATSVGGLRPGELRLTQLERYSADG